MQMIVPAVVMYAAMAVVLVWLGIGSIMARRWARDLLLIFSWTWLIMGVFSMAVMSFVLPHMMEAISATAQPGQPQIPAGAASAIVGIQMAVLGVIYLIMPGAWVFFYSSRNVKATCEAYDPVVRWTDRCPLPVLAVSLWLAISAPMMVVMAVVYKGILPAFGTFVVGPAGSALCIVLAVLWAYAARAIYRRELRGWWIAVATIVIFSASAFVTYSRHDVTEVYQLMGYPQAQIDQIQKMNFMKGSTMAWGSICGAVPLLGYLIYLRRFFPPRSQSGALGT
jgi:hypothetical protein